MKNLFIFDLDDTLVKPFTDELLPGVAEWFAGVDWNTTACAIATNQGGVGLRYWMETGKFGDPSKYPTENDVNARLILVRDQLVGHRVERLLTYTSFRYQSKKTGQWCPTPFDATRAEAVAWAYNEKHPQTMLEEAEDDLPDEWKKWWRKPNPGMLVQAVLDGRSSNEATVFVGNGEEDEEAAKRANIRFAIADEFFGRKVHA